MLIDKAQTNQPLETLNSFSLSLFLSIVDVIVGFDPDVYSITEAEEQVTVCVEVLNSFNGKHLHSFSVVLLPTSGIIIIFQLKLCQSLLWSNTLMQYLRHPMQLMIATRNYTFLHLSRENVTITALIMIMSVSLHSSTLV